MKINTNNEANYRLLIKTLNEKNSQWHSYENKQFRPIRVMVKKLHQSCKVDGIKTAPEENDNHRRNQEKCLTLMASQLLHHFLCLCYRLITSKISMKYIIYQIFMSH